jgi:hypothetical protein
MTHQSKSSGLKKTIAIASAAAVVGVLFALTSGQNSSQQGTFLSA